MSSVLMIPIPPKKLARRAWMRVLGLLLLGLLGAAALGFYGYQLHRLDSALNTYKQADLQHQMRTEAIHRLSDMETAFNRYLLDENSANMGLLQSDKQRIEQLGQSSDEAKHDQLLQNMVAAEQKWYSQAVQPMMEERRKLAGGQGLPEDFLGKYRASSQDLQLINSEIATENDYRAAQQALEQTQDQLRWLWLPYFLAVVLILGVMALGVEAMKSVSHLKRAAEGVDEEDEDGEEPEQKDEDAK